PRPPFVTNEATASAIRRPPFTYAFPPLPGTGAEYGLPNVHTPYYRRRRTQNINRTKNHVGIRSCP
ncbi:MAG: hypothetical protein J2P45_12930, partial [Candidatus Dormibacteraeota bacterium]|nr:hypothetical protein [Candidatus Dormibacteraeota bacterium]